MKVEINEDFYCSGNETIVTKRDGFICCQLPPECENAGCGNYHRKHPTPSQYKEEYGEEYPESGAVYYTDGDGWNITAYEEISELNPAIFPNSFIVCACTPYGMPDDNWRPE